MTSFVSLLIDAACFAQRSIHRTLSLALLLSALLSPRTGSACACGCGIFNVAGSAMLPDGKGGVFSLDYNFLNQNHNWSGNSPAPASNNEDKRLQTDYVTATLQYMFNRSWGVQLDVPFAYRSFTKLGGASGEDLVTLNWGDLGDVRLKGIYTGFSEDLSMGVDFGVKLPTGNYTHNDAFDDVDRDSEIGTGSTDLLLGGFFRHNLPLRGLQGFVQAELDLPVLTQGGYQPGLELNASAGVYYNGWSVRGVKITPMAQVIFAERTSDRGVNSASPVASGYQRVLLSPGVEFDLHPVSVYADVEIPVYQYFTGNQLAAPVQYKVTVSYHF